jgi:glycosyltransferase involved in cell wall biosynthesis
MKRIIFALKRHGFINILRIFILRIKTAIKVLYTSNPEFANALNLHNSEKNVELRSSIYNTYNYSVDNYNTDYSFFREFYSAILEKVKTRKINQIVVVNSGVTFNTKYNQRPLNLAKNASENNKLVLFVTWQWYAEEPLENAYKQVYPNVFQIPMYKFLGSINQFEDCLIKPFNWKSKIYLITLPSRDFILKLYKLRELEFTIVYDIMDEWEEFHKLGQAIWYKKELEEELIINSDAVFAVSSPLIEKFNYLRTDILLNGNGYSEEMLGKENKLIATNFKNQTKKLKIGYFGHLTESWFDWPLVFELAKLNRDVIFEIIGYGCSDQIEMEIEKYQNINFLGQKKHDELVDYAKHWKIGLIPFKNSTLSEAVDPIKIYEYLYFGIPVVSSGIPHLKSFPNTWVINNFRDGDQIIKDILLGKVSLASKNTISDFLVKTQWDERFKDLFISIEENSFISNLTKL